MAENQDDNMTVRVGPDGLAVTAPFLRLFRKKKPDPVLDVAGRFLKLFADHGISVTQIPRLMSGIGLGELQTPERLLAVLTPERIAEVATLFGVRREWVEGTTLRMYEPCWCYKSPDRFFEELKTLSTEPFQQPVHALCTDERFDERGDKQPITFVLSERICEIGRRDIFRYKVFGDQMDWKYWKCQIQIRVMIRLYYQLYKVPVPIYVVNKKDLRAVDEGMIVPGIVMSRGKRLHDLSLEDFSMFRDESAVSNGEEELRHALAHCDMTKLEASVTEIMGRPLEPITKTLCQHEKQRNS